MKFRITITYTVYPTDRTAPQKHTIETTIETADAPMAIQEALDELTARTAGIITNCLIQCSLDV